MDSIPTDHSIYSESVLMQAKDISVRDLIMITGFDHATLNFLAPFNENGEVQVTLEYGGGKQEVYNVTIPVKDQPLFSKWVIGRAQKWPLRNW